MLTTALPGHPAGLAENNFIDLSTAVGDADYDRIDCKTDALGRLSLCTDQLGDTTENIYDMASRLTLKKYFNGGTALESSDEFVYDKASRVLSAYKGRYNNSIICEYDNIGRKFKETVKLGRPEPEVTAQSFTTECSFDDDSRKDTCEYPSGKILDVGFDSRNQLETVVFDGTSIASFTYDNGMREKTRTFGNGIVTTSDYYNDNTRKSISVKDSGGAARADLSFSYTFDDNKNVLTETSTGTHMAGFSWTATFDDIDRVETFSRNNGDSQNFDMDPLGNWLSTTGSYDGTTFSESRTGEHDDVNQLLGFTRSGSPRTELDYDDKGNLTQDEYGATLVWDNDNKLKSYTDGSIVVNFAYDASGRRLVKDVAGTDKTYFISHGSRVIEEYTESSGSFTLQKSYVHGSYIDDILAKVEAGATATVHYYHSDRQFNIRALTDENENELEYYAYSPFGKQTVLDATGDIILGSAYENNYGFTGRYLDIEINLWYFRARYFSDSLGRFITRDPLGYVDGMSFYNGYFAEMFGLDPEGTTGRFSPFNEPLAPHVNPQTGEFVIDPRYVPDSSSEEEECCEEEEVFTITYSSGLKLGRIYMTPEPVLLEAGIGGWRKALVEFGKKLINKCKYPTKANRGGIQQPYSPISGQYMSYSTNSTKEIMKRVGKTGTDFAQGMAQGFAEGETGADGATPSGTPAGKWGYTVGKMLSAGKGFLGL